MTLFDHLPMQVLAIDGDYVVAHDNRSPNQPPSKKCYELLWNRSAPCEDCQLQNLLELGRPFRKAGQSVREDVPSFISCEYSFYRGLAWCFIDDQTRVIQALKKLKEQAAQQKETFESAAEKQKAQLRMVNHKADRSERFLDGISVGALFISEQKRILQRNKTFDKVLSNFYGRRPSNQITCHEALYGLPEPCEDCPISDKDFKGSKRTEKVAGRQGEGFLTEEITRAGAGFVLTLTDSTRVIDLSNNIKANVKEIQDMNQTLNSLMVRSTQLQNVESIDRLFEAALDEFDQQLFAADPTPMVFLQMQAPDRSFERVVFRHMEEPDLKAFLSRFAEEGYEALAKDGWTTVPFSGNDSKGAIGFFTYQSCALDEKRLSIMQIFINFLASLVDIRRLMADLERQANIDGLTGTYNRAYFEKRFEEEQEKARKVGLPFGLVVIDLNGLKRVNDLYGHLAGDTLIKTAGVLLGENIREHDLLSRFGGDEYVILLPSTPQEGVSVMAERLKSATKDATYCFPNDKGDTITETLHYSVGAASSEETDINKVFNLADERMYEAKELFYKTHERYR
jgi:diguanylate cyclase (GGDEF)-like protein